MNLFGECYSCEEAKELRYEMHVFIAGEGVPMPGRRVCGACFKRIVDERLSEEELRDIIRKEKPDEEETSES